MSNSISITGSADGPTSVFLAGKPGLNWLNLFGLIFVILLLIPNIIYALKAKNQQNKCTNKFMNVVEQISRYGCMILMVFHFGIAEFGFPSVGAFFAYLFGSVLLLISYWVVWILYFHKQTYGKQIALAVIPTCQFILSGVTMRYGLLITFSIVFGIAHIYVTSKNRVA